MDTIFEKERQINTGMKQKVSPNRLKRFLKNEP